MTQVQLLPIPLLAAHLTADCGCGEVAAKILEADSHVVCVREPDGWCGGWLHHAL